MKKKDRELLIRGMTAAILIALFIALYNMGFVAQRSIRDDCIPGDAIAVQVDSCWKSGEVEADTSYYDASAQKHGWVFKNYKVRIRDTSGGIQENYLSGFKGYCTESQGGDVREIIIHANYYCGATLQCRDTDSGLNYNQQGTVTDAFDTYSDYCMSGATLKEYYCGRDNFVKEKAYTCPPGSACSSGRCQGRYPTTQQTTIPTTTMLSTIPTTTQLTTSILFADETTTSTRTAAEYWIIVDNKCVLSDYPGDNSFAAEHDCQAALTQEQGENQTFSTEDILVVGVIALLIIGFFIAVIFVSVKLLRRGKK